MRIFVLISAITFLAACGGSNHPFLPATGGDGDSSGNADTSDALMTDRVGPDSALEDLRAQDETSGDLWEPVTEDLSLDFPGGGRLEVKVQPLGLRLYDGGEMLWDAAEAPLSMGLVEEIDPLLRYDPTLVPPSVTWYSFDQVVGYRARESGLELLLDSGAGAANLLVERSGDGILTFSFTPEPGLPVVLVRLGYKPVGPEENFYGLGENYDSPVRRGRTRELHHQPSSEVESGYNEAHVPVPLLISTNGTGIFIEEPRPGTWDVCDRDPDRISATFSARSLRFHLLRAEHPMEVLEPYYRLTGLPSLPPVWAFGVLQWRDEVSGQAMVLEDAMAMREHDLPCSAIWIDRPFATAHESFIFDPERYPDPEGMIQDLHDLGYRVMIWSVPYLSEEVQPEFSQAEEEGLFVQSPDIQFEKFGKLMDFTNPAAVELWQGLVSNATDIGIEGFKLDYGEDVLSGFGPLKLRFSFFNGEDEQTMHHRYALYYHQTYKDTVEGGAFELNRAGTYGDQAVTSAIWPGDLDPNFKFHREDGAVGGLPAAIAAGLSLSTSGYPFFGADTGGYLHHRPTKEVLLRWVAQTAISTTLQFGGAGDNCNPWDFQEYRGTGHDGDEVVSQYDQETLDLWRSFTRLHIRLFPYLYTLAIAASAGDRPVVRPFGFARPELGRHPDLVYFLGDDLLFAPIFRHQMEPSVKLPPESDWVDWFTGEVFKGGEEHVFAQPPLSRSILLVRLGASIPMLRPGVDTLAPASAPEVDSYGNDPGRLYVRTFPGFTAAGTVVFDGSEVVVGRSAGSSVGYADLVQGETFDGWVLEIELVHLNPAGLVEHVVEGTSALPRKNLEEVDTCDGCWALDPVAGTLRIGLGPGAHHVEFGPLL